jgi:hypothetical protein
VHQAATTTKNSRLMKKAKKKKKKSPTCEAVLRVLVGRNPCV